MGRCCLHFLLSALFAVAALGAGGTSEGCGANATCTLGLTCVAKIDGSSSSCIECSEEHFSQSCASWDDDFRQAAMEQCGVACAAAAAPEESDDLVSQAVGECDDVSRRCQGGLTCVTKDDQSYSQCVDCSPSKFPYACGYWDNELRWAAVKKCGLNCDSNPPVAPCSIETSGADYGNQRCSRSADGTMTMSCERPNPFDCGVRLRSDSSTGAGYYEVSMQAMPGPGVATTFYLYTYGEDNMRNRRWSEIDIEVLGRHAHKDYSLIWTNFYTAPFNPAAPRWRREVEHATFIRVPFDASAGMHTYALKLTATTIEWLVDGRSYRREDVGAFSDMVETIAKKKFQTNLAAWGQNRTSGSWAEMGYFEDSTHPFPLLAKYKGITLPGKR